MHRIGSLGLEPEPAPEEIRKIWAPARELGWIEGANLVVERRRTTRPELLQRYAEELVRLDVELIATVGTPATIAAKNATRRIPIVMYSAGDPVATGLVASLARPGGNVTGFSVVATEIYAKVLSNVREILPDVQRVGYLVHAGNPYYPATRSDIEKAFRALRIDPVIVEIRAPEQVEDAIAGIARRKAQALLVASEPGVLKPAVVMPSALKHRLPGIASDRAYAEAGGLLSLYPDDAEHDRIFAYFVDKILRGAKPADLPVQQPSRFALTINTKTAKALGLEIPASMLQRADEVIA